MALLQTINKYAWVGVLRELIKGDYFSVDSDGNYSNRVTTSNLTSWAGSGAGGAPTPSSNVRIYGFDQDGIIGSQMYFWNGASWTTLTGVTHAIFLGV